MAFGKFVSYIRVSTSKQGRSGLGLEAQRSSIMSFLNGGNWELIKEFTEVESGKRDDRPELMKALQLCQFTGATLIIAKLDRLSRDPDFLGMLMKNGEVDFVACDMPDANKFTIRIMAALAEKERELISERTKAALKAAQDRGVKLGTNNLTHVHMEKGRQRASEVRKERAIQFAAGLSPMLRELKNEGKSLRQIAAVLNERHIRTSKGVTGKWTATQVKVILERVAE